MTPDALPDTDLLGRPLTDDEREILSLYGRLHTMAERTDIAPCISMNVKQAMVLLWNTCVDLELLYEEPEID